MDGVPTRVSLPPPKDVLSHGSPRRVLPKSLLVPKQKRKKERVLSETLERYAALFSAVDASCALLSPRGVQCSIERIHSMGIAPLTDDDARRLAFVAPALLTLQLARPKYDPYDPARSANDGEQMRLVVSFSHAARGAGSWGPVARQRRLTAFRERLATLDLDPNAPPPMSPLPRSHEESLSPVKKRRRVKESDETTESGADCNDEEGEEDDYAWMADIPLDGEKGASEFTSPSMLTATTPTTTTTTHSKTALPLDETDVCNGLLGRLVLAPSYKQQILHVKDMPARQARFLSPTIALSDPVVGLLSGLGISQLYAHQALAVDALLHSRHTVVATSTASGKSLCYLLPIFERLVQQPDSITALLVFPTKALAQDQLRALNTCIRGTHLETLVHPAILDGDTPAAERTLTRATANVILTNPDTLHVTVLPNHTHGWQRFLSHLAVVVLDESHTYHGTFGAHVAVVLRRLERLLDTNCAPSDRPVYVCCSATTGNPRALASRLLPARCATTLTVIDDDGSACGRKLVVVWRPPEKSAKELQALEARARKQSETRPFAMHAIDRRRTDSQEAASLLVECVLAGLRTLLFCRYRKQCEVTLMHAHDELRWRKRNDLLPHVTSYRGGYSASDRRDIERRLYSGELLGVVATNALELGIDIGVLDVTLHAGFPGSVASLWQQAGRAGRSTARASIAVLVLCQTGATDAFFAADPKAALALETEQVVLNPDQADVLEAHTLCAAAERPLDLKRDALWFGGEKQLTAMIERLAQPRRSEGPALARDARTGLWHDTRAVAYPARAVHLRDISESNYRVLDSASGEVLDEIEPWRVFFEAYPGAVYANRGVEYVVESLDVEGRVARARQASPLAYYTRQQDVHDVHVGAVTRWRAYHQCVVSHAPATSVTHVYGFHRLRKQNNERIETVPLDLPKYTVDTAATWVDVTAVWQRELLQVPGSGDGTQAIADIKLAVHAAAHALVHMLLPLLNCDRGDLGTEHVSAAETPLRTRPVRLLVYDRSRKVGVALAALDVMDEALRRACVLVASCPCVAGCKDCVFDVDCPKKNQTIDKSGALLILRKLSESCKSAANVSP